MKRWRAPKAKPGELKVAFGKEPGDDPELFFCYGGDGATRRDSALLAHFFGVALHIGSGKTLCQELEVRGYDITTLKFSIQKVPEVSGTPDHNPTNAGKTASSTGNSE